MFAWEYASQMQVTIFNYIIEFLSWHRTLEHQYCFTYHLKWDGILSAWLYWMSLVSHCPAGSSSQTMRVQVWYKIVHSKQSRDSCQPVGLQDQHPGPDPGHGSWIPSCTSSGCCSYNICTKVKNQKLWIKVQNNYLNLKTTNLLHV